MDNVFSYKRSLLTQIAFQASYGASFFPVLAILIEAISSLQVFYVILATSFPSSDDHKAIVFDQIWNAASFIGLLDSFTTFETELFTLLIWLTMSIYILTYTGLTIWIGLLCLKGTEVSVRLSGLLTKINVMHSKVFFCPIYYFYLKAIVLAQQCERSDSPSVFCETTLFVFTIIFTFLNVLLAVLKDTFFYQTYKNQNACAVQNNFPSLIQLIHKIILLPLLVLINQCCDKNVFIPFLIHSLSISKLFLNHFYFLAKKQFLKTISKPCLRLNER